MSTLASEAVTLLLVDILGTQVQRRRFVLNIMRSTLERATSGEQIVIAMEFARFGQRDSPGPLD